MKFTVSIAVLLLIVSIHAYNIAAQADDDEVITVDSSIVLMNAAITDGRGKAVRGLTRSQFHVFEDGVEQDIRLFQNEDTPLAVVILLDTSGSMEQRVTLARSAAIQFLDGLRAEDYAEIY